MKRYLANWPRPVDIAVYLALLLAILSAEARAQCVFVGNLGLTAAQQLTAQLAVQSTADNGAGMFNLEAAYINNACRITQGLHGGGAMPYPPAVANHWTVQARFGNQGGFNRTCHVFDVLTPHGRNATSCLPSPLPAPAPAAVWHR